MWYVYSPLHDYLGLCKRGLDKTRPRGTPYNCVYVRGGSARRGHHPQVYKRVGISLFEVCEMKGWGNLSFQFVTGVFYGCDRVDKTFWFCDLFIY